MLTKRFFSHLNVKKIKKAEKRKKKKTKCKKWKYQVKKEDIFPDRELNPGLVGESHLS